MYILYPLRWVAIAMATTSCMTYQYVTLSSNLEENIDHEFTFENDSLVIRYNFSGNNCPVNVYVENKLNTPLYVDWKRSAIIENKQSIPYWQDESFFEGNAQGAILKTDYVFSSTSTDITGNIHRNESVTFLPPGSFQQTNMILLQEKSISTADPKKDYSETVRTPTGLSKAYFYDFEKENSPKKFRSFLTLAVDPSFQNTFTVDHEFWVSEITESSLAPASFTRDKDDGNQYHVSKSTGVGAFLGVIFLVGLIALGASQ